MATLTTNMAIFTIPTEQVTTDKYNLLCIQKEQGVLTDEQFHKALVELAVSDAEMHRSEIKPEHLTNEDDDCEIEWGEEGCNVTALAFDQHFDLVEDDYEIYQDAFIKHCEKMTSTPHYLSV